MIICTHALALHLIVLFIIAFPPPKKKKFSNILFTVLSQFIEKIFLGKMKNPPPPPFLIYLLFLKYSNPRESYIFQLPISVNFNANVQLHKHYIAFDNGCSSARRNIWR